MVVSSLLYYKCKRYCAYYIVFSSRLQRVLPRGTGPSYRKAGRVSNTSYGRTYARNQWSLRLLNGFSFDFMRPGDLPGHFPQNDFSVFGRDDEILVGIPTYRDFASFYAHYAMD